MRRSLEKSNCLQRPCRRYRLRCSWRWQACWRGSWGRGRVPGNVAWAPPSVHVKSPARCGHTSAVLLPSAGRPGSQTIASPIQTSRPLVNRSLFRKDHRHSPRWQYPARGCGAVCWIVYFCFLWGSRFLFGEVKLWDAGQMKGLIFGFIQGVNAVYIPGQSILFASLKIFSKSFIWKLTHSSKELNGFNSTNCPCESLLT